MICFLEPEGAINQSSAVGTGGLTKEQQESLEIQIKVDVDKIKKEFAVLQTVIRLSLKEKGVTAQDVAAHVIGFGVSEADQKKLETEQSLEKIFMLLTNYWSFLDCDLLDSIAEVYGSAEDHRKMAEYQRKLRAFCKRRLSETPKEMLLNLSNGSVQSHASKRMTVKLNMSDPRLSVIKEIKATICKILNVKPEALVIKEIKRGCIEITYFILESVSKVFINKPLTKDQCDAFRAAAVLSLSCGHFQETFTVSL